MSELDSCEYYTVQEINRFEIEVTKVNILEDTGIFYTEDEITDILGAKRDYASEHIGISKEGKMRYWLREKFNEAVIAAVQPLLQGEKKSIPIPPKILDQIEKRSLTNFFLNDDHRKLRRRGSKFILVKKVENIDKISVLPKPKNPWKIDLLNLIYDAANAYYVKVIKEHDLPTTKFDLSISKKITNEELVRVFQYYKSFVTIKEIMEYVKKLPRRSLRGRVGPQEYFYETLYKNPEQIIKKKSKA